MRFVFLYFYYFPAKTRSLLPSPPPSLLSPLQTGLEFRISPEAFFQVNSRAAEKLIAVVQDKVPQLNKSTTLLDICCGTGTLGLSFAKSVKKVVGMDICAASVRDANVNAAVNGITNCTFTPEKAEDAIRKVLSDVAKEQRGDGTGTVVGIVDPPRAGLHKVVIQNIRQHEGLKHLIYISCNIAGAGTNVMDLCRPTSKKCKGTPFRIVQAIPVDLFPHCEDCELVLVMERMEDDQPTYVHCFLLFILFLLLSFFLFFFFGGGGSVLFALRQLLVTCPSFR